MIITYFRSSSFNQWSYCQQSYFMTYVLGHQQASNQKADMGTVVHKTLEVLAALKKFEQDNPTAQTLTITDDAIGKYSCSRNQLREPRVLVDAEVGHINKSRANQTIYKTPCDLPLGYIRYGYDVLEEVFDKAYTYYSTKYNHHTWTHLHRRDCLNWSWMAVEHLGGICDPRKRTIVEPERRFDITIEKPWAKFKYGDLDGYLSIKGTIDLITQVDDDTYEIIDWKTGQRLDWATGERKNQDKLDIDPQLMLYYYAAKNCYPDKEIILTINFIRDGGPFSICFDEEHIGIMESKLEERFNEIKKNRLPKLLDPKHKDFRCHRLCHFYKNKWPGTNMNMCDFIKKETLIKGIDKVTQEHKAKGHSFDTYNAPGE